MTTAVKKKEANKHVFAYEAAYYSGNTLSQGCGSGREAAYYSGNTLSQGCGSDREAAYYSGKTLSGSRMRNVKNL